MGLNKLRISKLLKKIGNPHESLPPVIHIAGTNGKGSVLSYIKSCLLMDKQKVNAFTSPHLIKITERILIDNKFNILKKIIGPLNERDLEEIKEIIKS